MSHISQREAHRLRKRVRELEHKLSDFGNIEERINLTSYKDCSRIAREVELVEKLGFEARMRSCYDSNGGVYIQAVRRRADRCQSAMQ